MAHFAAFREDDGAAFTVRRPTRRASSTTWLLRVLTVCLAVAGLMVVGNLALSWSRLFGDADGRITDPAPVFVYVGEQRLEIPGNMIRFANQRGAGPHQHVDLAVHVPSMEGYSLERHEDFFDGSPDAPILYLTIRKRETATDSAGRLANVYRHFFEDEPLDAPPGLVGHRLSDESGLEGEEVYFEPGSANPFTVHCLPADASGYPAPCLSELHAGTSLSVQLRFRKGLLDEWITIREGAGRLLLGFGLMPAP